MSNQLANKGDILDVCVDTEGVTIRLIKTTDGVDDISMFMQWEGESIELASNLSVKAAIKGVCAEINHRLRMITVYCD